MENIRNMFRVLWKFVCYLFHIFVLTLGWAICIFLHIILLFIDLIVYTFIIAFALSVFQKKMNK